MKIIIKKGAVIHNRKTGQQTNNQMQCIVRGAYLEEESRFYWWEQKGVVNRVVQLKVAVSDATVVHTDPRAFW